MRLTTMAVCQQLPTCHPPLEIPSGMLRLLDRPPQIPTWQKEKKLVVIMGATGTGKSRLSIDLATQLLKPAHSFAEIINSDKMQVYKGLDIVTNKIAGDEMRGVNHHLLGTVDPDSDFTSQNFSHSASSAIESILMKGSLPIVVGGSNSYVEALLDEDRADDEFRFGPGPKYDCCFLWLDVAIPVLHEFVSNRVDEMVENGMVEEVREMFDPDRFNYSRGIRKSIGVPELDTFLRAELCSGVTQETKSKLLKEAIEEIKRNTCELACRQLSKIRRLKTVKGWNLHRIDATEVFKKRGTDEVNEAWEKLVARPSSALVRKFLYNVGRPAIPTREIVVPTRRVVAANNGYSHAECLVT
ncbi:Adenylate isopentenyltransferase 3, chloroplastic [Linum grandiflorum]